MAKIIQLRGAKVGRRFNGVTFPQIYRIVGHPDGLAYSLAENVTQGLTYATATPIHHLDESDTGWLIIRHHPTLDHADGYLDGLVDLDHFSADQVQFQTEEGVFTLLERPPREDTPDRLIIYCAGYEALVIDEKGAEHDDSIAFPEDI